MNNHSNKTLLVDHEYFCAWLPWNYGYQTTTVLLYFCGDNRQIWPFFLKKLFHSSTFHTNHHNSSWPFNQAQKYPVVVHSIVLHSTLNFFNQLVAQTGFEPKTFQLPSLHASSVPPIHMKFVNTFKETDPSWFRVFMACVKMGAGDAWHPRDFRTSLLAPGVSNS